MQNERSRRRYESLPLDNPQTVAWVLEDHEARLSDLENQEPPGQIETPLGKLPWQAVMLGAGLLAWLRPDLFSAVLHRVGF